MKLMLIQLSTKFELKLKLKLSLAISNVTLKKFFFGFDVKLKNLTFSISV